MKAVLCKEHGLPETLVMEEIDAPVPGKGEILLDVHSAAVNFPDYLIIQNKYQMKPELPFSPGSEVAGRVAALGEGVDGLKVGDKVLGLCGFNGFREQTTLPAAACVPMPDAMSFHVGASLIMTYGTSYHALKQRAQLQPGETIFIMGASGGVGLAAIDLAKTMGAKVIAAASTEEKLDLCRAYGADETLLYPTGEMDKDQAKAFTAQIKELSGGKGVDVIYDPVGDVYAEPAIRAMAWNGRYLVIGFAAGEIPKMPLNLTLLKGCSIVGVFWGQFTFMEAELSAQNNRELMEMEADGRIKPHVSKVFSFEQTAEAIAHIGARQATGKVVVEVRA